MKMTLLLVCTLLFGALLAQAQNVSVTFQVNMKVQMKKQAFDPSQNQVSVRGDFNGWGETPMLDADGDSIYAVKIDTIKQNTTLKYKYFHSASGGTWENDPNKELVVGTAAIILAANFFNGEQMPSGAPANVTFEINMKLPAKADANFLTKKIFVAGSFTDWGTKAVEMTDANKDSIYTVTTPINSAQLIQYKFIHTADSAHKGTWENLDNRKNWIVDGNQTISKFWENKDPNITLADGNIIFRVDMSVLSELGIFDPSKDSVRIYGSFNGWGSGGAPGTWRMNQGVTNPLRWSLTVPFVKQVLKDTLIYKFFIKSGASSIPYANTGWEVAIGTPTIVGDRNRQIVFEGTAAQTPPIAYFDGVQPNWVIPTGTTVKAEFSVDMTPATKFNPLTDTVYWIPRHPIYYSLNKLVWDAEQKFLRLLDPDGDKIYKGTLTINGPAFNGFLYNYAYTSTTGLTPEDGGQSGARVRYIGQSGGPRKFDTPWTMPRDVWTNGEKPEEAGPQGLLLVRDNGITALSYELNQNFPNPFNPSTTIKFQIQNNEHVTLKVFNLLGQEVAMLVNEELTSGSYRVNFDGKSLSSGVYFYKIESGSFTSVKKMMFLK